MSAKARSQSHGQQNLQRQAIAGRNHNDSLGWMGEKRSRTSLVTEDVTCESLNAFAHSLSVCI